MITRHFIVADRLGLCPPNPNTFLHKLWLHHRGHHAWCVTELLPCRSS